MSASQLAQRLAEISDAALAAELLRRCLEEHPAAAAARKPKRKGRK